MDRRKLVVHRKPPFAGQGASARERNVGEKTARPEVTYGISRRTNVLVYSEFKCVRMPGWPRAAYAHRSKPIARIEMLIATARLLVTAVSSVRA
jgi:hypothetical protein